jgi:hypothetical protein
MELNQKEIWNSKHVKLTEKQIETLKRNFGIHAEEMTEEEVLKVLRKKYKHYKFIRVQ